MEESGRSERIGGVLLDYGKYPGEDFYSEGAVEDELLEITRTLPPEEYEGVIGERREWSFLYHLSPLRENIVEWIPMEKGQKVLEVGSGCGALTGVLARKAGSVTCVELSKKRSLINAYRHRECHNVAIHVGNFRDVEPGLEKDFDYIFLIGVFEYAASYMGGEHPYEDFLKILARHLKKGGRMVIAIENKYGLKYFAGCAEDHLGAYFSGIENYPRGGGVRTFGRKGLERIFTECGMEEAHFYYPYPDYKFMHTLYSDRRLPGRGELSDNLRNFDRDRMVLFDEKSAYDGLVEEGMFPDFSNSFCVVLGKDFPIDYVRYSNDRAPEHAVKTQICRLEDGRLCVRKYPQGEEAFDHVRNMEAAYEMLWEKYRGGRLEINRCRLLEEEPGVPCAEFEFVEGTPLLELMNGCLDRGDMEGFAGYFREYFSRIDYHNDYPVADFDLIFSNILVKGDVWTLIDYEWTFGKRIATKELAFRAVYYLALDEEKRGRLKLPWILEELDITEAEAEGYWEQEKEFQRFVAGSRLTLAQMRDLIGHRLMEPQNWINYYQDASYEQRVQVYEDRGGGCSEEHSYFVREAYLGENLIEVTLHVGGDVKLLRIDPAMDCCMVKILEMTFNGERVPLEKRKVLLVNGRIVRPADKQAPGYSPCVVFPTTDPNLNINLELLKRSEDNILHARMEIVRIPKALALDMAGAVKKLI